MAKLNITLLMLAALAFHAPSAQRADGRQSPAETAEGGYAQFIDRSFEGPQNLGANINEGSAYVAQTYTAGATGRLLAVSIDVRSKRALNPEAGFKSYPLRVALCAADGNVPGAVLGEVTLKEDEAGLSTLIKFRREISQVKGRQYAIVVSYAGAPASGAGRWLGVWAGGSGDIGGVMWAGHDGRTWVSRFGDEHTLRFRTYVAPRGRPAKAARRK